MILFPSTLFPTTRLAAALSWDASQHDRPSPERPAARDARDARGRDAGRRRRRRLPRPAAPAAPAVRRGALADRRPRARRRHGHAAARAPPSGRARIEVVTDAEGRFAPGRSPPGATVCREGCRATRSSEAHRRPRPRRRRSSSRRSRSSAAYLTYYGVADRGIRSACSTSSTAPSSTRWSSTSRATAGWIPYRTEVQAALDAGAQGPVIIKDFDELLADLQGAGHLHDRPHRGLQGQHAGQRPARPGRSSTPAPASRGSTTRSWPGWIRSARRSGTTSSPSAKEAVAQGLRRGPVRLRALPHRRQAGRRAATPSRTPRRRGCPPSPASWPRPGASWAPTGAFVGADLFGYTAFNANDTDIGQRIEELAPHLDYICPMVYPSGYHMGIPGYPQPGAEPLRDRPRERAADPQALRATPWRRCGRGCRTSRTTRSTSASSACARCRAQIRGADDGGGSGWMLWNPRNDYTGAALRPKTAAISKSSQ